MNNDRFHRVALWCGIGAAIAFALGGLLGGPPGVTASAAKQIAWYRAHKTTAIIEGVSSGYFVVVMAIVVAAIRRTIHAGETDGASWSTVAFAGGVFVMGAVVMNGLLQLMSYEAASHRNATAITTLAYGNDLGWFPWAAGSAVLFLGTGIGALRTRTLPKWLAVATTVLGVMSMGGPTGIIVFFLTPIWLVTIGIVLSRRPARAVVDVTSPAGTPAMAG